MFNKKRYATAGIMACVDSNLMKALWSAIDKMPVEKDYLQVFKLTESEPMAWTVVHSQEEPEYSNEFMVLDTYGSTNMSCNTIFVIDDGDYSTMLFADER